MYIRVSSAVMNYIGLTPPVIEHYINVKCDFYLEFYDSVTEVLVLTLLMS